MEWTKRFKGFFNSEKNGGLLLLFCTAISLFIANSQWGEGYIHFWHSGLELSFASLNLNFSVEQWINDGLMSVFFLLVGLEVRHEFHAGELSSFKAAMLPAVAAVGGMVVPAGIYLLFNAGAPSQAGFGIPMATDIAFSLGMLALTGSRVPYSLKVFLTALAIIDDIGAIIVIALFYNTGLHWNFLAAAAGIVSLLFLLNKLHFQWLFFYLLTGVALWYCALRSGIHPTIAGVLLAFVIPYHSSTANASSYQLQKALHIPVAYFILPLFALANTGIPLQEGWSQQLFAPTGLGIVTGLVIGKPLGILFFCWVLIKSSNVLLPQGAQWKTMFGAAALAGIGFTMSIFISNLAFGKSPETDYAKVAVLVASLFAAIIGLTVFFFIKKRKE